MKSMKIWSLLILGFLFLVACKAENQDEGNQEETELKESTIRLKLTIPLDQFILREANTQNDLQLNAALTKVLNPLSAKSGVYFDQFRLALEEEASYPFASLFASAHPKDYQSSMSTVDLVESLKDKYKRSMKQMVGKLKSRIGLLIEDNTSFKVYQNNEGYISIDLSNEKDVQLIKQKAIVSGKLIFYEVYQLQEVFGGLVALNTAFSLKLKDDEKVGLSEDEIYEKENPLLSRLIIQFGENNMPPPNTSLLGLAASEDTALLNQLLLAPGNHLYFPSDLKFIWQESSDDKKDENLLRLYAIKNPKNEDSLFTGRFVQKSYAEFDENGVISILVYFTNTGARKWTEFTTRNVGKQVVITFNDKILSIPVIQEPMTDGSGKIFGKFTYDEAQSMADMIQGGALKYPLAIVDEIEL